MKKQLLFLLVMLMLVSCHKHKDKISPILTTDEVNKDLILEMVNNVRIYGYNLKDKFIETDNHNLCKLTWNNDLYLAAKIQSLHIYKTGEFRHVWSSGVTPNQRLQRVNSNRNYRPIGENIAWGYRSEVKVLNGWLNSTGHRECILNNVYNVIGVSNINGCWTMVLGYDPYQ